MNLKSNPYLTVLTIVFGLLLLYYFFDSEVIFYTSLILSGLGVFSIKMSITIEKIWFKFSFFLSQIVPNILLSFIFYLILTPISFLSKIFKYKTEYNLRNNHKTNFVTQNKSFDNVSGSGSIIDTAPAQSNPKANNN